MTFLESQYWRKSLREFQDYLIGIYSDILQYLYQGVKLMPIIADGECCRK